MTQTDKQCGWRRKRLWVQLQVGCSFPTGVERAGAKCWRGLAASLSSCRQLLSSCPCCSVIVHLLFHRRLLCQCHPPQSSVPCSVIVSFLCYQSPALSLPPCSVINHLLCHCPLPLHQSPALSQSPFPCHSPPSSVIVPLPLS